MSDYLENAPKWVKIVSYIPLLGDIIICILVGIVILWFSSGGMCVCPHHRW